MGAGSGSLTLVSAQANAGLTVNATTFTGTRLLQVPRRCDLYNLTAGARGASRLVTASTSSITFTQTAGASEDYNDERQCKWCNQPALGDGDGSGDVAVSIVNTESTFSLTGVHSTAMSL